MKLKKIVKRMIIVVVIFFLIITYLSQREYENKNEFVELFEEGCGLMNMTLTDFIINRDPGSTRTFTIECDRYYYIRASCGYIKECVSIDKWKNCEKYEKVPYCDRLISYWEYL